MHAIVTGGALDPNGRWRPNRRRGFLFPVRALGAVFRGKFLTGSPWVVYCKRPFAGPEQVLSYLSQYTHRVAISERRIEAFDPAARTVTFRWRDYAEGGAVKRETLPVDEFLRRFRRHLLPRGFTKVRHYGLLANHARKARIPVARAAIARLGRRRRPPTAPTAPAAWPPSCAHCGGTAVHCRAIVDPDGRRHERRPPRCAREPP